MQAPKLPPDETARLAALRRYEILDTPPEEPFDALTRFLAHVLDVPIALVSLVDAERQWFKSRVGLDAEQTARAISFCGHVVEHGRALVVEDASRDQRFADNPLVVGDPKIGFYAGYPLCTAEGHVLGTLCAIDQRPRTLDERGHRLLEVLASQVVAHLELRQKVRESDERERRLRAILETAMDTIVTLDDRGTIEAINPAVQRHFGYRPDELLGQPVSVLLPTAPRELGSGRELTAVRKDGRTVPVEAMVSEVRLGERRITTAVLRDISQRKQAELTLNNTLADLRKSHEDLLHVLDAIQVGVLLVGADKGIAYANEAALGLLNVPVEDVTGRTWEEALQLDEPSRQAVRAMKATPERERSRLSLRVPRKGLRPVRVELDLRDDPRDAARLIFFLYDVSDVHELKEKLAQQRADQMVGESPVMHALFEQIAQVARGDWTVLVEGETGTGKELVARAIHAASPRRGGEFIAVNCAGLSDSLLASQLFGHVRGAFTGATADQQGLIEAANGGTLFLDEIGDISVAVQASLLRVLQEKEITRVGETRPRKVNVRFVLATHRDLKQRVQAGAFREDLLYRIRHARVRVPPLRERKEDIPLLANAFLAQQRVLSGKLATEIGPAVMERLVTYDWPGNVRELRAAIEHALVRSRGRQFEYADLPSEILEAVPARTLTPLPMTAPDRRGRVVDALHRAKGNRVQAAKLLGVGRATLYRWLDELEL